MAKNKNKKVADATTTNQAQSQADLTQDQNAQDLAQAEPVSEQTAGQAKHAKRQAKLEAKKQARQKEQKKSKKAVQKNGQKQQRPNKGKEVVGELKKVTWPTFGTVVKNTLLVIGIVVLITIGLFAIDRVFSWLYQLIVDGAVTSWWK